jgi:hypothetical protein
MPPNSQVWSRPLAQVIALKSGKKLKTLAHARDILIEGLRKFPISTFVKRALAALVRAAASGEESDRKLATDKLLDVLCRQRLTDEKSSGL